MNYIKLKFNGSLSVVKKNIMYPVDVVILLDTKENNAQKVLYVTDGENKEYIPMPTNRATLPAKFTDINKCRMSLYVLGKEKGFESNTIYVGGGY